MASVPIPTLYGIGRVGPQSAADGTPLNQRMERTGAQVVTDAHGRLNEAAYRGNVFFASTQAGITFSTSLTTTTVTGFILSNPPNSGKNLSILQAEVLPSGTTQVVGLFALCTMAFSSTSVTHTTALSPTNAFVGNAGSPVGKADSGATLPVAPVVTKVMASTITTNPSQIITPATIDIAGGIILAPGTAAAIMANAGCTAFASMLWEEIPL